MEMQFRELHFLKGLLFQKPHPPALIQSKTACDLISHCLMGVINHISWKEFHPHFDTNCWQNSGKGTKHVAGLCLRLFYGPVSQVSLSEQNEGFAGCNWQARAKVRY